MVLDDQEPTEIKNGVGYYQRYKTWERPGGMFHGFDKIKSGAVALRVGQVLPPTRNAVKVVAGVGYVKVDAKRASKTCAVHQPYAEVRFTKDKRPPYYERCLPQNVMSRRDFKSFLELKPVALGEEAMEELKQSYNQYQQALVDSAAPPTPPAKQDPAPDNKTKKRAASAAPPDEPPAKRMPNIYALWTAAVKNKLGEVPTFLPEGVSVIKWKSGRVGEVRVGSCQLQYIHQKTCMSWW
jgi:hypothetical protein